MNSNNSFILFNKDTPVLYFHCERTNNEPIFIIDRTTNEHLPFGFQDINNWLANRRVPKNRAYVKEILEKCNCNDLEGYIRFTFCASLNDTFWIKPTEEAKTWKDISLYRNEFDTNIARIAFDGGIINKKFVSTTPELSTDGSFAKCWRKEADGIYLYKRGSTKFSNSGLEPFSELYASELAKNICDNSVSYDVVKHHGKIAAKCCLFTNENISYAPYAYVSDKFKLDDVLHYFDSIGAGDAFRQMMVLDALTLNTDRHGKNFGVLYDSDSFEIIGMAPVFDNNLSLCPYADITELQKLDEYMPTRTCAFDNGFNEIALKCMTPQIKNTLLNLQGFSFNDSHQYHLPKERLDLLSNMVNLQISNLLQEKIISFPAYKKDENINLENFSFTVNKKDVSQETWDLLSEEKLLIKDFNIRTKTNEFLNIKDVKYMANISDDIAYVEIYDSQVNGTSESLEITSVDDITLYTKQRANANNCFHSDIEVQLSRGDDTEFSTIKDCEIIVLFGDAPHRNVVNEVNIETQKSDSKNNFVSVKEQLKMASEINKLQQSASSKEKRTDKSEELEK